METGSSSPTKIKPVPSLKSNSSKFEQEQWGISFVKTLKLKRLQKMFLELQHPGM
jgi:hypothetical protein